MYLCTVKPRIMSNMAAQPPSKTLNDMMNARNLLAAMLLVLPFTGWAQDDDVYFVPKKKAQKAQTEQRAQPSERYLPVEIVYEDDEIDEIDDTPVSVSGSSRDVDEYNRRGSRSSQLTGEMVQNPDGTFTYRVPASDTLYVMGDSTAITTEGLAQELYTRGYEDGMADGEDYAYSRRIGRFGYSGIYASPWYYSYYDPFYWDDYYYYHPYHGYYGLYHWGYRPYWGYSYYHPYWYGGYYGWGGYHHHSYGRTWGRGNNPRNYNGGRGGGVRGGRAGSIVSGGRTRGTGSFGGGRAGSIVNSGRAGGVSTSRSSGTMGGRAGSISSSSSSSRTVGTSSSSSRSSGSFGGRAGSVSSSSSSSSRSVSTSSSSSSRSSGSFGGGSFGGSSSGGGRSGGFSGGGGSRGGGGGGGRGGR